MKKYITIEVLIDETIEGSCECANEVINGALGHCYCCDGTVKLEISENNDEILKRLKNDNGERYTSEDAIALRNARKNKK